jgi:uncharacterized protein YndB with AHSA1/START domain
MTDINLITRRLIAAPQAVVFAAWTEPEHLRRWWGPAGVRCPAAEIDLRVGGRWRIANELPSGELLWIAGVFERVEVPRELVYSWAHEPLEPDARTTRVTVRFEARGRGTEVIVIHARFADDVVRDTHAAGWAGCLDGLESYFDRGAGSNH